VVSIVSSRVMPACRASAVALALSITTLLPACKTIGETNVHGVVVTETMVAKLTPGTSQEQVVEIIGTPSTTSTINGEAYYYVSQTSSRPVAFLRPHLVDRTVFVVYFDKGKVTRVAHYGMEDGVVFDTISRTTPTAGSELSFITQLIRGLTMGVPGFGGSR
jgi:outer membrane protein assembly factor BamE (lipoprotein component of BamABCDE complex)